MNTEITYKLFSNWHARRWVALLGGSFFVYQAYTFWEIIPGLLGALLLFQAITQSGCFGAASCGISPETSATRPVNETEKIEFTEISEEQYGKD